MVNNQNSLAKKSSETESVNYSSIVASASFKELMRQKRNFILPMSIFFMIFYFTLPVLTSYTSVLNKPAIGAISWAWVFAGAQFIMTWALCIIYSRKAAKFDEIVEKISAETGK
ncbi:DUF485 domain-containing protein [Peribacillus saganii]|uniref:DUF485 domain-containing protein n=1 Tax=Peribacillus saganii TaxID=2303992 RepID=A0A372LER5_9BACI|nr:DUF485 domain-containing protein [Peribacillus saganii]RFU64381.1 DUF485 domain-containing protein [Peribacillus saganii]